MHACLLMLELQHKTLAAHTFVLMALNHFRFRLPHSSVKNYFTRFEIFHTVWILI